MEPPIDFLTLHRDAARHAYFRENPARDPFFDAHAQAWIVTNPSHCRELIASGKLRPATYEADYEVLGARLGIDFSGLIFAFDHIPLCQHGAPHERTRRRLSEFLATRKADIARRLAQAVPRHFDVLKREGRVELMKDAVVPFVLDMMSTIVDIDVTAVAHCEHVSAVFDRSIGVGKRRRIAAEIAALRETIRAHLGPEAGEEEVGLKLALLILGHDTLIGTLGEGLYRLIEQNPNRRLADIDYPALPPETGVPWIERSVVTPFVLAGCAFEKGDRLRIFLQAFVYADTTRSRMSFFGAGAHACLGRPLSIDIWTAITGLLSTIALRASLISYCARNSDYVFTCPQKLEVALSP